ncbi:uncharacterized protein LOC144144960 [Haemaphysalis longicornis]
MFSLGLSSLSCLLLAAAASAYICSDFTRKCSAASVFKNFGSGFRLASTAQIPALREPAYLMRVGPVGLGGVTFRLMSRSSTVGTSATLFGHSDTYLLRHTNSEPYSMQIIRIPFADYRNCFVADYARAGFGCRLWVKETASPRAVAHCLKAIATFCSGPLYTTWDQQCVRGCGYSEAQWSQGESQQKRLE